MRSIANLRIAHQGAAVRLCLRQARNRTLNLKPIARVSRGRRGGILCKGLFGPRRFYCEGFFMNDDTFAARVAALSPAQVDHFLSLLAARGLLPPAKAQSLPGDDLPESGGIGREAPDP